MVQQVDYLCAIPRHFLTFHLASKPPYPGYRGCIISYAPGSFSGPTAVAIVAFEFSKFSTVFVNPDLKGAQLGY